MKTEMEYTLLSHHLGDIQTFHQKSSWTAFSLCSNAVDELACQNGKGAKEINE